MKIISLIAAFIGMMFSFLFGELDSMLIALLVFIGLDYLTGVIKAVITKHLSSEIGFKGILKKVLIIFLVAIANMIDVVLFHSAMHLRTAIITLFIANEGISIVENAAEMGVPIPEKLKDILYQLKKKDTAEENIPINGKEKVPINGKDEKGKKE